MTSSKELLHKLNNQLGVILAHAELLETKAQDASQKARATSWTDTKSRRCSP